MYEYKCTVVKVIDGDTVDVDIDLGFNIWLRNERVRISGIDAPETRSRDRIEKLFGFAAKKRLTELLGDSSVIMTQKPQKIDEKFGRILGDFVMGDKTVGKILMEEGHAIPYSVLSKEEALQLHEENRQRLLNEGVVDREEYEKLLK
jgi:micrococcal nuclease